MAKNKKANKPDSSAETPEDAQPSEPAMPVAVQRSDSGDYPPDPAPWLERLRERVPTDRAALIVVFSIGFLMFFPYLGTLGLWDCWEPHYSEVAREMIVRGDYVYPFWESHYFFSKPAMTLWMIAAGMLAVGAEARPLGDSLGHLTEWGIRTPFALLAIFSLWAVYRMTRQMKGGDRSAGLLSVIVLATSAMFIFIGKQAMADMPLVGFMTIGLAFFCAAVFSDEADAPAPSWMKALTTFVVALCVFGQLGLIGEQLADNHDPTWPLIPAAVLGVLYMGAALGIRAFSIPVAFVGLTLTWLTAVVAGLRHGRVFSVDTFKYMLDRRLEGSRFDCYLMAFYVCTALSALSKGLAVLAVVGPLVILYMIFTGDWRILDRSKVFIAWPLFLLVASPWYVTLSLFQGRDEEGKTFVQRFWLHDNFSRVGAGVHGDRAGLGYFVEQLAYGMFPWIAVVPSAIGLAARSPDEEQTVQRRRMTVFVLIWALWTFAFFSMSQTKFHHYIFPAVPPLAILVGYWLTWVGEDPRRRIAGYTFILVAVLFAVTIQDLIVEPQHLVNLFTYKYDRDYPREINPRAFLIGFSILATVVLSVLWALRQKANALLAFGALGVLFGLWISHYHFNMLTPHWSQAHLFKTYYTERIGDEPLYAYQLNWRGETFYSRNRVIQVKESGANERMRAFVDRPGREFIITEQSRFHTLRNVLSPDKRDKLQIIDKSNNKFYLCVVEE